MRMNSIHRCFLATALATALTLLSGAALAQFGRIDRLVIFGASLSDSGNSFIWLSDPANQACGTRLNVPPYDALDDLLAPDGPYAKGGHHFTNGATWDENLARALALAGNARPAFRHGGGKASNYAVGGARAVDFPCRFNLPAQVDAFVADFGQVSPQTLIAIEIGGNDVRDALIAAATQGADPAVFIGNALTSLSNGIMNLYARGARKFLLLNVGDVGKIPSVLMLDQQFPGIAQLATDITLAYNAALLGTVNQLNAGLSGSQTRVLDIYGLLGEVLADPSAFGITNTTTPCVTPNRAPYQCGNPDSYLFWDGIHPTAAVHAIIGQRALTVISAP